MTGYAELSLLALVLGVGTFLSRRMQRGYIDFLTPLLAVYFIHYVTRGFFDLYLPEWLELHPVVLRAPEAEILEAVRITTIGVAVLIVSYLVVTRLRASEEAPVTQLRSPTLPLATWLLGIGLAFRFALRLAADNVIALPAWALTPIETFGWAGLAGLFLAAFIWGRAPYGSYRTQAAVVACGGALLILVVDARWAVSREAAMQPILVAVVGRLVAAGKGIRQIAIAAIIAGLPLFIWVGSMKTYSNYNLGEGAGYVESIPVVRQYMDVSWPQFVIATVQERFHGLDSLIVCRAIVPEVQPYETGSVWQRVLLSAFVPRLFFPQKDVGWGVRFAVDFWGMSERSRGTVSVGISQLGLFYIFGGVWNCVSGMAILGAGLALLAAYLRRRGDVPGLMLFVLTAVTVCQIDRDLEGSLGGVLKLFAIFFLVMFFFKNRFSTLLFEAPPRSAVFRPTPGSGRRARPRAPSGCSRPAAPEPCLDA